MTELRSLTVDEVTRLHAMQMSEAEVSGWVRSRV